jgi:hypothetical protein
VSRRGEEKFFFARDYGSRRNPVNKELHVSAYRDAAPLTKVPSGLSDKPGLFFSSSIFRSYSSCELLQSATLVTDSDLVQKQLLFSFFAFYLPPHTHTRSS